MTLLPLTPHLVHHGARGGAHRQHGVAPRGYLRPPGVRHHVGDEAETPGPGEQQHELLLGVALEGDLGLARALPHPQRVGTLPPGLLVGGERGVTALGRRLALAHLEVLAHHQHHLGVLVIRDVSVVTLVPGGTNWNTVMVSNVSWTRESR